MSKKQRLSQPCVNAYGHKSDPSWLIFERLQLIAVRGDTYGESGENIGPRPHGYPDEALQPAAKQAGILLEQRVGTVTWE